jgi:hypothetical protein
LSALFTLLDQAAFGKTLMQQHLSSVALLILGFGLISVGRAQAAPRVSPSSAKLLPPALAQRAVGQESKQVLLALRANNMTKLAAYVHPNKGLRFSPYIAPAQDLKFSRVQLRNLPKTTRKYVWGSYDGSGEPVNLTWNDYRRRFVYPTDFSQIKPRFNSFVARGNIINGLRQTYKDAIFVEYYWPGTKKHEHMDWRSLWLIWQKSGARWYLSGIAGDRWST